MVTFFIRILLPATTRTLPAPDVILGSTVHPLAAFAGLLLARRKEVPFVYEIRDLWPRTLIDMNRLEENGLLSRLLSSLETYLYKRADLVVTLLPKVDEYFAERGFSTEKILWISNGVEIEKYPYTELKSPAADEFTLMYIGSHGEANCLYTLINAYKKFTDLVAEKLVTTETRLVLIGSGIMKGDLQKYTAELEFVRGQVEFRDPIPRSSVPQVAQSADAFVVTVKDLPSLYRYGISMNKLFDYMAAARPVLLSSSAANDPIEDAQCGISTRAEDEDALANSIEKIVKMSVAERAKIGLSGRQYVEAHFSYTSLAAKLATRLDHLTGSFKS